jgi:hypothetical protein
LQPARQANAAVRLRKKALSGGRHECCDAGVDSRCCAPAGRKADQLAELPTKGEFFTDEAVEKAASHTRVLLALTAQDIGKRDIYPFLALSRGLMSRKNERAFGIKQFGRIAHPTLKLFWGAVLFDQKAATPEIVAYLRAALESKEQAELLTRIEGPHFEDFKKRLKEYRAEEK